jgi:hypothetical protein
VIILYLEYQSVYPYVLIGSLRPLSRKGVCPPPLWNQRGESDDWRESLALCRLCECYQRDWYESRPAPSLIHLRIVPKESVKTANFTHAPAESSPTRCRGTERMHQVRTYRHSIERRSQHSLLYRKDDIMLVVLQTWEGKYHFHNYFTLKGVER